jgi:hypothetical protein
MQRVLAEKLDFSQKLLLVEGKKLRGEDDDDER